MARKVAIYIAIIYFLVSTTLSVIDYYDVNILRLREIKNVESENRYIETKSIEIIASKCSKETSRSEIEHCIRKMSQNFSDQIRMNFENSNQSESTLYAKYQLIIGIISIISSIAGIIFIYKSLIATRESISVVQKIGNLQVRAYISIQIEHPPVAELVSKQIISKANFKIENTGESPAYDVKYIAGLMIRDHPIPPEIRHLIGVDESIKRSGNAIPAKSNIFGEATIRNPIDKNDIKEIVNNGNRRLYVAITVFYKDVFEINHEERFCAFAEINSITNDVGKKIMIAEWILEGRLSSSI